MEEFNIKILREQLDFNIAASEFTDFPQIKSISNYQDAAKNFIDYYTKIKGVCAIYGFGDGSVPGISDLDFIVVLEDHYQHRYGTRYDIDFFHGNTKYVLFHSHFFINKALMEDINIFFPFYALKKIYGEDIPIKQHDQAELKLFCALRSLDYLIVRIPALFLKPILNKKMAIRKIMSDMNSLKYILLYFSEIVSINSEASIHFISKLNYLRSSWFKNDKTHNLSELMSCVEKAIYASYFLIGEIAKYLELNYANIVLPNFYHTLPPVGFRHIEGTTYFEKNWDAMSSLNRTIEVFHETNKYNHFLPFNFCRHLFLYVKSGDEFGNYINHRLIYRDNLKTADDFLPALKRAGYINKYIDFMNNKKIIGGAFFAPFDYRPALKKMRGEYKYSISKRWIDEKLKEFRLPAITNGGW